MQPQPLGSKPVPQGTKGTFDQIFGHPNNSQRPLHPQMKEKIEYVLKKIFADYHNISVEQLSLLTKNFPLIAPQTPESLPVGWAFASLHRETLATKRTSSQINYMIAHIYQSAMMERPTQNLNWVEWMKQKIYSPFSYRDVDSFMLRGRVLDLLKILGLSEYNLSSTAAFEFISFLYITVLQGVEFNLEQLPPMVDHLFTFKEGRITDNLGYTMNQTALTDLRILALKIDLYHKFLHGNPGEIKNHLRKFFAENGALPLTYNNGNLTFKDGKPVSEKKFKRLQRVFDRSMVPIPSNEEIEKTIKSLDKHGQPKKV